MFFWSEVAGVSETAIDAPTKTDLFFAFRQTAILAVGLGLVPTAVFFELYVYGCVKYGYMCE